MTRLDFFMPIFSAFRYRPLPLLTSLIIVLTPLSAQAQLPDDIQQALDRAKLKTQDISVLITPVGNKNSSHLPPIINVTNDNNYNDDKQIKDTPATTASLTLDAKDIEQRERQWQAYTDDPATYQSLENPPPTLLLNETTIIRNSQRKELSVGATTKNSQSNNANTDSFAIKSAPLVSHYPASARTPASTMKLIPSFIALDTLGPDFTWFTRVYYTGLIIGNDLYGDLIIQGSGDPKMTHERVGQLLYQVQKAGIHHIKGDIIVDSSVFRNVSKDPGAFDNAPLKPYNASPDGFLVNFNSLAIKSYPLDDKSAQLLYEPSLANYHLPNSIDTRSATCSQAISSLAPQWQRDQLAFDAKLPTGCGEHIFYINYPDAKDFAARVIASKWQTLGNTLSGSVLVKDTLYQLPVKNKSTTGLRSLLSPMPLVSYPSLTLAQQLYDINHFSNNVMTEQVTLSIGSYSQDAVKNINSAMDKLVATSLYQFGRPKTTDYPQALNLITQWWQNKLKTPAPYLTNGSGLCRACTLSAANLEELLTYAYDHPNFSTYVNSLGVAGVSGTIVHHSERLPESAATGRAWIKTGSLNNVAAMAGYVKGQSGQDYTVVGLINTEQAVDAYAARSVLDAMLDWTAQQ